MHPTAPAWIPIPHDPVFEIVEAESHVLLRGELEVLAATTHKAPGLEKALSTVL